MMAAMLRRLLTVLSALRLSRCLGWGRMTHNAQSPSPPSPGRWSPTVVLLGLLSVVPLLLFFGVLLLWASSGFVRISLPVGGEAELVVDRGDFGLAFTTPTGQTSMGVPVVSQRMVGWMPSWLALIVVCIPALSWLLWLLLRNLEHERRVRLGLCPSCGYNLRATPGLMFGLYVCITAPLLAWRSRRRWRRVRAPGFPVRLHDASAAGSAPHSGQRPGVARRS